MKKVLQKTVGVGYAFDVVSLARKCQMVPENAYILQKLAGEMTEAIRAVYQGLDLVYCFTERGRRHVIASVVAAIKVPTSEEARLAFLDRLLSTSNEELIISAYGNCPQGFVPLLRKLGDQLLPASLYLDAYDFVANSPEVIGPVLGATNTRGLNRDTLELLLRLPKGSQLAKIWVKFPNVHAYEQFLNAYRIVARSKDITQEHLKRLAKGEDPSKLINELYLDAPFPAPAIVDCPGVTYLASALQLKRASKEFRNCLGSLIEAAFQGQQQFYAFQSQAHPASTVVFGIFNDMPFGYRLGEIKGVKNVDPPEQLVDELKALLAETGIEERSDTDYLVRDLQRRSRHFRQTALDLFGDF